MRERRRAVGHRRGFEGVTVATAEKAHALAKTQMTLKSVTPPEYRNFQLNKKELTNVKSS